MFRQHLKDYFTFSHAERRGIIFLLVLTGIVLAIRILYPHYRRAQPADSDQFIAAVEDWLKDSSVIDAGVSLHKRYLHSTKTSEKVALFDPNTIDIKLINALEISEKAKKSWIKYLQAGGRFYKKDDLKKIYGFDSASYYKLEPYISIKQLQNEKSIPPIEFAFEESNTIEVNSATRSDFESLYGVGPVLSDRIIKYRKLLGGFVNTGQLREVYGLSDSVLILNEERITVNKQLVSKIEINKAVYNDIAKHPYFTGYHASSILTYRKLHGNLLSAEQLRENNLVPDSVLKKVLEYLSFSSQ
ncbi:MAG: helix-hairpin-helix domain-containing protein [Bacteroidales bacterium]|nr:helix-hairpin-helix domain-containing protein [Bacteroidales bacterium]